MTDILLWWGMLVVEEAVHAAGTGDIREISAPTSQFCCEAKVILKTKVLKNYS